MFKEYLQHINGVAVYAIIGFLIFSVFFILITIHTIRMDKTEVEKLSKIPLDDESIN